MKDWLRDGKPNTPIKTYPSSTSSTLIFARNGLETNLSFYGKRIENGLPSHSTTSCNI